MTCRLMNVRELALYPQSANLTAVSGQNSLTLSLAFDQHRHLLCSGWSIASRPRVLNNTRVDITQRRRNTRTVIVITSPCAGEGETDDRSTSRLLLARIYGVYYCRWRFAPAGTSPHAWHKCLAWFGDLSKVRKFW